MKNERPPIIAVLGHVDHGKTTLLDTIRHSDVAVHESGGITQRIGAYEITTKDGKRMTFIDTPGHELFIAMRKRGVGAADIALLVVAADSSVKPQTIESLKAIQEAQIPFIVVINKIDLPTAIPEKVIKDLSKQNVLLEGRGGDVPYVQLSAKTGENLDTLFELIVLLGEMNELSYDETAPVEGAVIEVHKDRRGVVATVIVQNGTLKVGADVFVNDQPVRVRALIDDKGKQVQSATPSMPVEMLGLKEAVPAGATVRTTAEETEVNNNAAKRSTTFSFDNEKKFYFIVRADTYGSLEVLRERLRSFKEIELLLAEVGEVTENDIDLAETAHASVLAYRMPIAKDLKTKAEQKGVPMFEYQLAYELIDEIEDLMLALRTKREKEQRKRGEAKIAATFQKGRDVIAGLKMTAGYAEVGMIAEVVRGKKIVGETKIRSLYQKTDAVDRVERNDSCGMTMTDSIDFHSGDVVKFYVS